MKIAAHLSMFCKTWKDDVSMYLPILKQAGFDGVEVSLFGGDERTLYKTFEIARREGLEVICGTGIGPETDVSSNDASIRREGINYLRGAVELAAEAGALFLNGVLYAPWQAFGRGESRLERWKRSAESLRTVADFAKTCGIGFNCEVLNRYESDFINTIEEGVEFIGLVDRENVKLLADVFHMNIEEKRIASSLSDNIAHIGCIHVCENHRGVPGTGHIDWQAIITALKQSGYTGYLDMECFVESGTQVGESMFMWRSHADDAAREAIKGLRYLQSII